MIDYTIIKNPELRILVTASEAIHSLPADKIQVMVGKIAGLDPEGERLMVAALRDERKKVAASRAAKNVTAVMEMAQIKNSSAQLMVAARGFETEVNQAKEEASRQTEGPAETLLQSL